MKSKLIVALMGGTMLMLGACASETQQVSQEPQPMAGTEFNRQLATYYRDMADNQYKGQIDFWSGSEKFADKSMRASRGELVQPDQIGVGLVRDPVKMKPELTDARARLINALNAGSATRAPAASARAQAAYDCWLDEASDPVFAVEGPWLDAKVQNCRSSFDTAMNEINATSQTSSVAQPGQQLAQAQPAPVARAAEQSYLVFFDFDKSNITPEAEAILRRAVQNVKSGAAAKITATGHADRSGTDEYNVRLSQRRADAVRSFLIREGITANQIQTAARGEAQPLVQTADGVREPQNRRVEILLDRNVAGR